LTLGVRQQYLHTGSFEVGHLGINDWRWLAVAVALWLLVMVSAVAVINVVHTSRLKLNQLELAKRQTGEYQVAWGQYRLEQGTLATYSRVELIAQKKLGMKVPELSEMVIIQ